MGLSLEALAAIPAAAATADEPACKVCLAAAVAVALQVMTLSPHHRIASHRTIS